MVLQFVEQTPLYDALNFNLRITDPGSQTVRASNLSVYLCPSSDGAGPIRLSDCSGKSLVNDLSPGQYVVSAGQFQFADWPSDNNVVFFRNSRVGLRDITDGLSLTMMAGERSLTISDATWVGVVPSAEFCTKPATDYEECRPSYAMVLAHTGPTPPGGYTWVVDGASSAMIEDGSLRRPPREGRSVQDDRTASYTSRVQRVQYILIKRSGGTRDNRGGPSTGSRGQSSTCQGQTARTSQ